MQEKPPQSKFNSAYILVDRARHPETGNREEVHQLFGLVGMRAGERLLDACCGYGRHLPHFARAGLQTLGVDRSRAMYKEALAGVLDATGRVEVECKDVVELAAPRRFHYATLLFNSFGYGAGVEEDVAMLRALHRLLVRRGRLVLQAGNPEAKRWHEGTQMLRLPEMNVEEERVYHPQWDIWEVRHTVLRGSWKGSYRMVLRRYDLPTLTAILTRCGFAIDDVYAHAGGVPFLEEEHETMLLVCTARPED